MDRYWLLTNTYYGQWLSGDERGFVGRVREHRPADPRAKRRVAHDLPGEEYDQARPGLSWASAERMSGPPIALTLEHAVLDRFQIAWKLFSTRWHLQDWKKAREPTRRPRILFLADRNTLANQAYNDFNAFTAFKVDALVRIKPDEIKKKGRPPTNGNIFFTIFQTFMCGPTALVSGGDLGRRAAISP